MVITLGVLLTLVDRTQLPAGTQLPVLWGGTDKHRVPYVLALYKGQVLRVYHHSLHTFSASS